MTKDTPTPYDGTAIFKPVVQMKTLMAQFDAARKNTANKLHEFYAGPEVAEKIYKDALKRLSAADMISPAEAARRMNIAPQDYIELVKKGEALLIQMGRKGFVPAWTISDDSTINPLKLDIAREFVLEGQGYFKFIDYIRFMTAEKADIGKFVSQETLSMIFYTAGVQKFDCTLSVKATMSQLADMAHKNKLFGSESAPFAKLLLQHLDAAVTHGGWDPSGGLSRPFRDKYNIPGLTIHEERSAPRP